MADEINRLLKAGSGGADASIYSGYGEQPNALAIMGGMQQLQNSRTQNQIQQFDLANRQLGAIQNQLGALASKQDLTFDDVIGLGARMSASGLMPREAVSQELQNLSRYQNDPEGLRKALGVHISAIGDAQLKLQTAYGSSSRLDMGGHNVGIRTFPTGGTSFDTGDAGRVPYTLNPGQKTQTQDYVDPGTGAGRKSPIGELYDERGNFVGTGGIPVNRGGPRGPAPVSGGGGAPSAPGSAPSPANAGPAAASPAVTSQAGSLPTSLGPAAARDIETSANEFTTMRNDLAPSRDRVFGLVSALDAVRGTNVGPGTSGRQKLLSAVNALPGGIGKGLVPDGSNLSDYDVAKKYLAQVRTARPGAGRSDASLAAAGEGSPNVESMSKEALVKVATTMVGQERMRQAQTIDFINRKGDPGQFSNHAAQEYSKSNDPEAFALGAMTPPERAAYVRGLKGEAKTRFMNGVRLGLATGVLSRDDLVGAAGGQ